MQKWILPVSAAALVLSLVALLANLTGKIGIVDLNKLMEDSPKAQSYEKQLADKYQALTEELEKEKDLSKEEKEKKQAATYDEFLKTKAELEKKLEREVAAVLTQIKGAGRVVVDLHLGATEETTWLYREERQERVAPAEQGGETRELTIRREPVFQRKSGGEEAPVYSGKKAPVINGVLVVAEGASDPALQRQLGEAAAVLLGVALHRVIVLPWG